MDPYQKRPKRHKPALQKILEKIGFEFGLARSQMAIFTAIIFLAASGLTYKQHQARINWPTTEGYVTSTIRETDANNQTRYVSVITYTVNGRTYSIHGDNSTAWKHHTGGTKQVVYNPHDPANASVKMSNTWKWVFLTAFPITGGLLLLYGLLGLAFIFRQ